MGREGVDQIQLAEVRVYARVREIGDELLGSKGDGEFLYYLIDYYILKKGTAPWITY